MVAWLKLAASLDVPYHTNEEPAEVLWRTLIADSDNEVCPAPSDAGKDFVFYLLAPFFLLRSDGDQPVQSQDRKIAFINAIQLMVALKIVTKKLFDFINSISNKQVPLQDRKAAYNQIISKATVFQQLIHQLIVMRRLFITQEKRYLGLGSESMQIRDEIWVLPRANTPVVLRELANGHFMVVGPAYVHGIMKGEAIVWSLDALENIILD